MTKGDSCCVVDGMLHEILGIYFGFVNITSSIFLASLSMCFLRIALLLRAVCASDVTLSGFIVLFCFFMIFREEQRARKKKNIQQHPPDTGLRGCVVECVLQAGFDMSRRR